MKQLAMIAFLLASTSAMAEQQQRTIYDANGRAVGTVTTDTQGSNTLRDATGRTTGRSSTDSQDTTTLYDASGRVTGRASGGRGK